MTDGTREALPDDRLGTMAAATPGPPIRAPRLTPSEVRR